MSHLSTIPNYLVQQPCIDTAGSALALNYIHLISTGMKNFLRANRSLSFSCKPSSLDLPQGSSSAQESNPANHRSHGQCLKQVPLDIVQEEHNLHRHNTAPKDSLRRRCRIECLWHMVQVHPKFKPYTQKHRQRDKNGTAKQGSDEDWR